MRDSVDDRRTDHRALLRHLGTGRTARPPPRVGRHAPDGQRRLPPRYPQRPRTVTRRPAPGRRAGGQPHRHGGLLLLRAALRERTHQQRALAVPRRPGHRRQGRPPPDLRRPVGRRRPARPAARARRGEPAPARAGPPRPRVPAPDAAGLRRRTLRRARRAARGGPDPPPGDLRRRTPPRRRGTGDRAGGERAEPVRRGPPRPVGDEVLRLCGEQGIAFVPFYAVAGDGGERGATAAHHDAVVSVARAHGVSPSQVRIAWTLHQGPHVLAIPGTGNPTTWPRTSPPARCGSPARNWRCSAKPVRRTADGEVGGAGRTGRLPSCRRGRGQTKTG